MAEPRRRFKFLKELAQGGFGKVYLAEMITGENFSSIVAIKLLHGKWVTNDEVVMRSRDEARLLGRLRHRNIVRVEDLTAIQGQCAIVMEYLQGSDLKTASNWLRDRDRVFPRQAAFEVIGAMASALDAAYSQVPLQGGEPLKVIHRDIKPSNAIVTIEGDVKVLDFGTARASFEEREAKTQALAFGSAAYMAPERLMGEEDTHQADIFSLGVTLYEILTLESFGKIHIRPEKFEKAIAERIATLDLSALPEGLQAEAREAIRLMLAYEPKERPVAKDVVELMEVFSEQCRDGGLKKFAREVVKEVYESHEPEQDPTDPYTGQMLFEDTTSFTAGRSGATEVFNTPEPVAAPTAPAPEPSEEESLFQVPVELADPAAPASSISGARPKGSPPPSMPTVTGPRPTVSEARPVAAAVSGPVATPAVSAPRPLPVATATDTFDAPPAKKGGLGKIVAALAVVGLLGVVGVGGAIFAMSGGGDGDAGKSGEIAGQGGGDAVPANPKLKAGNAEPDWAPNAAGKGGVILQVPAGASEVTITSSRGFREEWDGSANLRLKDLDPGTVRSKVKPKGGGPSLLADFAVEGDKTCLYTFKPDGGGAWEKSECR